MARLPICGGDENCWGEVLNDFLSQEHNSDGSLKIRSSLSNVDNTSDANKPISTATQAALNGKQAAGNWVSNFGVIRVNYTGLSLTGFTKGVTRDFPFATATASIDTYVESWPANVAPANRVYDPSFYNSSTNRLRENTLDKQMHSWRVLWQYSGKTSAASATVIIELYNPDSGFSVHQRVTTLAGENEGKSEFILTSVSDSRSLPPGRGYLVRAFTTFTDAAFKVEVIGIMRASYSKENEFQAL